MYELIGIIKSINSDFVWLEQPKLNNEYLTGNAAVVRKRITEPLFAGDVLYCTTKRAYTNKSNVTYASSVTSFKLLKVN